MYKTFQDFLKELFTQIHYKGQKEGLDDAFIHWIGTMDNNELIMLGESYGHEMRKGFVEKLTEIRDILLEKAGE